MRQFSHEHDDQPNCGPSNPAVAGYPSVAIPPGVSALQEVVDDDTPQWDAIAWAMDELYEDRSFEWIAERLAEGGWPQDDVAAIVEEARRRTRTHRGAVTRDQVALDADRLYRRATGRWIIGMPMLGAVWRLLHSIATLLALRRRTRRNVGRRS